MQTCTSNAKEKVRYVAFDRLGHKLITGIANTPQGFTRWERVRAPVPVARSDRMAAYRRRITPRLVPPPNNPPNQTPPQNPPEENLTNVPERERRIAVCYRNLVQQYELLVQRYLEINRPAATIDRGTDPMETEHLTNTTSSSNTRPATSEPTTSTATTSSTPTVTSARTSPLSMPGPSGLNRQNRPSKRPNTSKSDSSTVYQSDSSDSSDSDESPTPKRRISLVPNSNLFRKETKTDSSTSTDKFDKRKKLFMSRSSAFHLTRSGSSQSIPNSNRPPERQNPPRFPNRQNSPRNERRTVTTEEYLNMYPDLRRQQGQQESGEVSSPLSRLRGILRSLSSADEVINFSERTGSEEPETPQEAAPETESNEFSIENIYRNIISDLETVRNASRGDAAPSETNNILHSFSQRLESIMNQSDAILANLRQSMDILLDTPPNQTENSTSPRFTLRRPSGVHTHTRQCSPRCAIQNRASPNQYIRSLRLNRYNRPNRNSRHNAFESMWRPFGDHSYPRDPVDEERNRETIRNLITLMNSSPRSPPRETPEEQESQELPRSSTPVPFPSDHNYPITPTEQNSNPIADHTYPRDPQNNRPTNEYIQPLVSSLHSTISHISMQTNLLRRQVESIELIDRARFEVFQLQEMRRMWEEVRRHITLLNTDRRTNSNMSNVRQMMAWTRISDPSPSSESAQSSTEQSTPEPSPSTPDVPTPSTSRSSASSSNESRPVNLSGSLMGRFRQNHIKKRFQNRLYWRRRAARNETPNFAPRRFNRNFQYRDNMRQNRNTDANLTEVTVSLMIRGLETLLMQQTRVFGNRRDSGNSPERTTLERRVSFDFNRSINKIKNYFFFITIIDFIRKSNTESFAFSSYAFKPNKRPRSALRQFPRGAS